MTGLKAVDTLLNAIFLPLAALGHTPNQKVMLVIFGAATIVSFISTFLYRVFVNQGAIKDMKRELEILQKRLQTVKKKNNPEEMQKIFEEVTTVQMKMMSETMKPTMFSFLPIILIFGWLNVYVKGYNLDYVVAVPFPFIYSKLGWLGWYIMSSMAVSIPLRKLLGIEM